MRRVLTARAREPWAHDELVALAAELSEVEPDTFELLVAMAGYRVEGPGTGDEGDLQVTGRYLWSLGRQARSGYEVSRHDSGPPGRRRFLDAYLYWQREPSGRQQSSQ